MASSSACLGERVVEQQLSVRYAGGLCAVHAGHRTFPGVPPLPAASLGESFKSFFDAVD